MTSTFVESPPVDDGVVNLTVRESGTGHTVWYFHDEVSVDVGSVPQALAESARVLAPIHPGFAGTPRPEWAETTADIADLYTEAIRASAQNGPVAIVASSLGAWIAAEVALTIPDHLAALALISPLGLWVPGHPPADHWFMRDNDRTAALYADPDNKPVVDEEEYMANESMAARLGWNPRFASRRLGPRLARLDVPTLLVWGSEDRLLPVEHRKAWRERIGGSGEVVIDNSGHYPVYERPAQTADAVSRFLSETLR